MPDGLTAGEVAAIDAEVIRLTLTEADARNFADAELIIREGLRTFYQVGAALTLINANRWYRAKGHATFASYCREEWQLGDKRAYQLITAAEIVSQLSTVVDAEELTCEAVIRPLTRLDATDRPMAWEKSKEAALNSNRRVTAADVTAAVDAIVKPPALYEPENRVTWEEPLIRGYFYRRDEAGEVKAATAEIQADGDGGYLLRMGGKPAGTFKAIHPAKEAARKIFGGEGVSNDAN